MVGLIKKYNKRDEKILLLNYLIKFFDNDKLEYTLKNKEKSINYIECQPWFTTRSAINSIPRNHLKISRDLYRHSTD